MSPANIINTSTYNITDAQYLGSAEVAKFRDTFSKSGILILPDFIDPSALELWISEANKLAPLAHRQSVTGNCYLANTDDSFPADHPINLTETTLLGAVANDLIPNESVIKSVYQWDPVTKFIETVVNKGPLHRYSCPLGCLNIAVMQSGDYLRWHFDLSDFVVSIPIQEAKSGGIYEYVDNIRSPQDPRYDEVKKILKGSRSNVSILEATPGSLVFFQGKNTLHRVTPLAGDQLRLGALLSYSFDPNTVGSEFLNKMRYGRGTSKQK